MKDIEEPKHYRKRNVSGISMELDCCLSLFLEDQKDRLLKFWRKSQDRECVEDAHCIGVLFYHMLLNMMPVRDITKFTFKSEFARFGNVLDTGNALRSFHFLELRYQFWNLIRLILFLLVPPLSKYQRSPSLRLILFLLVLSLPSLTKQRKIQTTEKTHNNFFFQVYMR